LPDIEQVNRMAEEKVRLSDTPEHSGHSQYIFGRQPAQFPQWQLPPQDRLAGKSRIPRMFLHRQRPSIGKSQGLLAEAS
jgi:hypothetical protein